MNTAINIFKTLKRAFLLMIISFLFACSKGGEPIPMASSSQSTSLSTLSNTNDNSTMRVVGGDDKEDDDDKRGPKFPKRR